MRKEVSYVLVFALVAIAALGIYYVGIGPTGYAVFGDYTNETDCVGAGYLWEDLIEQNCTVVTTCVNETVDVEPCLEYEDLNGTQGDCITWTSEVEEVCTDDETCVDVVIGGQCVGDVCDIDNLNLCLDETTCTGAIGYWYDANEDGNSTCNVEEEISCSNDLTLCDETNCVDVGSGYWYDDVCNDYECVRDGNCDSGYECDGGDCVETEETTTEEEEETVVETPEVLIPARVAGLTAGVLPSLSLNPGNSQEVRWSISNTGTAPVSSCIFDVLGDFDPSWIVFSPEIKDLSIGASKEFVFNVVIPEDAEEGDYPLEVSVGCTQITVTKAFSVNVEEKKLEFDIISVDRTRKTRVRVLYSLEDLVGEDQNVEIYFSLLGVDNQEIANASENISVRANRTKEFKTNLIVNESLEGNLTLSTNFNSQIYSSSVQELVNVGTPVGGFAIFGEGGLGTGSIVLLVIVVAALVVVFLIVRKKRLATKK